MVQLLVLLFVGLVASQDCADENNMCPFWAESGECEKNPGYMLASCALSCQQCKNSYGVDMNGEVSMMTDPFAKNPMAVPAKTKEGGVFIEVSHELVGRGPVEVKWLGDGKTLSKEPVKMFDLAYGEKMHLNTFNDHVFSFGDAETPTLARFRIFPNRPFYALTAKAVALSQDERGCADKPDAHCPGRAKRGECSQSPGWMSMMCSRSCDACHLRDPKTRCSRRALNMRQETALKPGGVETAYRRLVGLQQPTPELGELLKNVGKVTVHSAPEDVAASLNASIVGPWIVTIDDFITKREANEIVGTVNQSFSRSTDQGAVDQYGEQQKVVSTGRTSENAWCTTQCEAARATKDVTRKIEIVTGVPKENYESFQVLRYLPGQYYRSHHDMSGNDNNLACGPRVYTFFLYFSDVAAGGETEFNALKTPNGQTLKIRPKAGSALWWPSVMDADPTRQDGRTRHAALAVKDGVKFAANAWIHAFDYREPNLWGCTGAFD